MTDRYQYRITFNGQVGPISDVYLGGDEWSFALDVAEERGLEALLERRLVSDLGLLDWFGGVLPAGYLRLRDVIICPWETLASLTNNPLPVVFIGEITHRPLTTIAQERAKLLPLIRP